MIRSRQETRLITAIAFTVAAVTPIAARLHGTSAAVAVLLGWCAGWWTAEWFVDRHARKVIRHARRMRA